MLRYRGIVSFLEGLLACVEGFSGVQVCFYGRIFRSLDACVFVTRITCFVDQQTAIYGDLIKLVCHFAERTDDVTSVGDKEARI